MNSSHRKGAEPETALSGSAGATDSGVVLAREAGVPFCPPPGNVEPFVEWLSLMEVA